MTDDLSPDLRHHLLSLGMSDRDIALCDRNTRLWQDLRLYREVAGDFLTDLSEQYQIDLYSLESLLYYPNEFEGKSLLARIFVTFVPFWTTTSETDEYFFLSR
jgi:hypothetical protein